MLIKCVAIAVGRSPPPLLSTCVQRGAYNVRFNLSARGTHLLSHYAAITHYHFALAPPESLVRTLTQTRTRTVSPCGHTIVHIVENAAPVCHRAGGQSPTIPLAAHVCECAFPADRSETAVGGKHTHTKKTEAPDSHMGRGPPQTLHNRTNNDDNDDDAGESVYKVR